MNRWLEAQRPLIVGHRGASADAPENTLRAFELAREQQADGIEFDIKLSADHIPVVFHDDTVERTTDGTGAVSDLTLAELQQLDAGDGEQIPTLDQVFEALGRDFLYNVEIKMYGWRNRGCERAVADCIRAHDVAHLVTVSSFDFRALYRARRVMPPETGLGFLRDEDWTYTHRLFRSNIDHPRRTLVSAKSMALAKKRGQRVHVWTVDDSAEAQRLIDLGVNALITNRPGVLRSELNL
jgi:glycerophosphoryl diester phosphodiesterase